MKQEDIDKFAANLKERGFDLNRDEQHLLCDFTQGLTEGDETEYFAIVRPDFIPFADVGYVDGFSLKMVVEIPISYTPKNNEKGHTDNWEVVHNMCVRNDVWDQALVSRDYSTATDDINDGEYFQVWSKTLPKYSGYHTITHDSFRTLWQKYNPDIPFVPETTAFFYVFSTDEGWKDVREWMLKHHKDQFQWLLSINKVK